MSQPKECPKCKEQMLPGESTSHAKCGYCATVKCWKVDDQQEFGMFAYLEGYKYPYKGVPQDRVLQNTAIFKRSVISTFIAGFKASNVILHSLAFLFIIPCLPFLALAMLFVPKDKMVRVVVHWMASIIRTAYTQPTEVRRLCRSGRELVRAFSELLRGLEGEYEDDVRTCIMGCAYIWEIDNAYRYRGQDIIGALRKVNLIDNPRKELLRVLNLGLEREKTVFTKEYRAQTTSPDLVDKWRYIRLGFLAFSYIYPAFLKKIQEILLDLNLEEVRLDQGDWYYCCERYDYDFGGLPYEERLKLKMAEDDGWVRPPEEVALNQANVALLPNPEFMLVTEEQARDTLQKLVEKFMADFSKRKQAEIQVQGSPEAGQAVADPVAAT